MTENDYVIIYGEKHRQTIKEALAYYDAHKEKWYVGDEGKDRYIQDIIEHEQVFNA